MVTPAKESVHACYENVRHRDDDTVLYSIAAENGDYTADLRMNTAQGTSKWLASHHGR